MKGIRVTAEDLETGETETVEIWNDYVLVCAGSCHQARIDDMPAAGTRVITIKGRGGDLNDFIVDAIEHDGGDRRAEAIDILARRAVACLSALDAVELWDPEPLSLDVASDVVGRIRAILDAHNVTAEQHDAAANYLAGRQG